MLAIKRCRQPILLLPGRINDYFYGIYVWEIRSIFIVMTPYHRLVCFCLGSPPCMSELMSHGVFVCPKCFCPKNSWVPHFLSVTKKRNPEKSRPCHAGHFFEQAATLNFPYEFRAEFVILSFLGVPLFMGKGKRELGLFSLMLSLIVP